MKFFFICVLIIKIKVLKAAEDGREPQSADSSQQRTSTSNTSQVVTGSEKGNSVSQTPNPKIKPTEIRNSPDEIRAAPGLPKPPAPASDKPDSAASADSSQKQPTHSVAQTTIPQTIVAGQQQGSLNSKERLSGNSTTTDQSLPATQRLVSNQTSTNPVNGQIPTELKTDPPSEKTQPSPSKDQRAAENPPRGPSLSVQQDQPTLPSISAKQQPKHDNRLPSQRLSTTEELSNPKEILAPVTAERGVKPAKPLKSKKLKSSKEKSKKIKSKRRTKSTSDIENAKSPKTKRSKPKSSDKKTKSGKSKKSKSKEAEKKPKSVKSKKSVT